MLFNSYTFIFFFLPIVVLVYYLLLKKCQAIYSQGWLVLASLFFYAYWEAKYLVLILISATVNYLLSIKINQIKQSKIWLVVGLIFNVSLLGYYKYADFFLSNVRQIFNYDGGALNIILPLAISFFTFQQIAFLVDSYHASKTTSPIKSSFLNYLLFVTFFPQLIAGPIVHHKEMMPQFTMKQKCINWENFTKGLAILGIGLFKKAVLADTFAIFASAGFADPQALTTLTAWTTSLAYTFQLYFDFSGYADMAIGAALMLNIKLPINFNSPYRATSIQDFWRRWHITLSRWLREYVYFPLGGSRLSQLVTLRNLFLTALISGLWHGAGWTFIIWGALHGGAMLVQRLWGRINVVLPNYVGWVLTFLFINTTWVIFRATSLGDANIIWAKMFLLSSATAEQSIPIQWTVSYLYQSATVQVGLMIMIGFILCLFCHNSQKLIGHFNQPTVNLAKPAWGIVMAGLIISSFIVMALVPYSEFIYFNF